MTTINISDLDIHTLIVELWKGSSPASFFQMNRIAPPSEPSHKEIERALENDSKYIDYLAGRCIKTDFSDLTVVSTHSYNRNFGKGKFESIVDRLRQHG